MKKEGPDMNALVPVLGKILSHGTGMLPVHSWRVCHASLYARSARTVGLPAASFESSVAGMA